MIRGLRYLANKLEQLKNYIILKWNSFLEKIKM